MRLVRLPSGVMDQTMQAKRHIVLAKANIYILAEKRFEAVPARFSCFRGVSGVSATISSSKDR